MVVTPSCSAQAVSPPLHVPEIPNIHTQPWLQCDQSGLERLSNLLEVTQLVVAEAGFEPKQTDSNAMTKDKLLTL